MSTIDRYAVIGNPVDHSLSPLIHAQFATETHQTLVYEKLLAPLTDFAATIQHFQAEGGKGANVTLPFKQAAYQLASHHSPRAEVAGAVNTLLFKADGSIFGDNTDGIGLVRDLTQNLHYPVAGQRILLIGAGGAAYGVVGPLLAAKPAQLIVANRSEEKAVALSEHFANPLLSAMSLTALTSAGHFDLIINATSTGLTEKALNLPHTLLTSRTLCYDLMFATNTPFMRWAAAGGAAMISDGLGMLVEQAAESFYIWRQLRPSTQPVLQQLRKHHD